VISKPLLFAVRLPAALPPETQSEYVFVGVRCAHCQVAYSVALPNSSNNADAIPNAIEWTKANMGACGAHPTVLYEDSAL
jgi:hypothetical protein